MIGGAPVTEEYARKIGAFAFAADAASATRVARELLPIKIFLLVRRGGKHFLVPRLPSERIHTINCRAK